MAKDGVRLSVLMPVVCHKKLVHLSKALGISKSAVVYQAIHRFYHEEPLVKGNGHVDDQAEVSGRPGE